MNFRTTLTLVFVFTSILSIAQDTSEQLLDFTDYERIWLGGDVCSEAMLEYDIISYIDSLFNISKPENTWALGNHDARNYNWEFYREIAGKKTFNVHSKNKVTVITLNTNITPADCEKLNDQYRLITTVCDTIQSSTDLILIMHHGIWLDVPGLPSPSTYAQSNLIFWNSNCYDVNSTFVNSIYPLLLDVKEKGINVTCLIGDMGANGKTFSKYSDDSILFLGCGLNNSLYTDSTELANQPKDKVLIFEHNITTNTLEWEFQDLDSLIVTQQKY